MNIDDLNKIKEVEVPPFLFTRIQQKIESSKNETGNLSKVVRWSVSLALAFIIFLNINLIVNYNKDSANVKSFAQSMDLITDNSLYK